MNNNFTNMHTKQFIGFIVLVVITLGFGTISAQFTQNTYTAPTTSAPDGIPPFPIVTNTSPQIKGLGSPPALGGGLGVSAVTAKGASQIDGDVSIRGLMLGNLISQAADPIKEYALTIGSASYPANFSVSSSFYADKGGLFSDQIIAPTGEFKRLCSTSNGDVVFCPPPGPPPIPSTAKYLAGHISTTCTDYRSGDDFHQGNEEFRFYFSQPTTYPMVIKMAYCDGPLNPPGYHGLCYGHSIIPGGSPSQYINQGAEGNPEPYVINLPAGATSFTSPRPWFAENNNGAAATCVSNGKKHDTRSQNIERIYLKVISPTPTSDWTLNFSGTSFQPEWKGPTSAINFYQVP